jgi:hypothetical protein
MSLWGLYQVDPTILDGLIVPTGMDGDNVKDNLLLETESMEILYPNTLFLKMAITVWAAERKDVWDKLYATTVLQYNPIENYDRNELSTSKNWGGSSGSTTTTGSSTAYDSDTFKDTGKSISSGSNTSSSDGTYNSRVHGNIGVTTTQQMIEQERRSVEFCMTEYIINDFIDRFCVGVY